MRNGGWAVALVLAACDPASTGGDDGGPARDAQVVDARADLDGAATDAAVADGAVDAAAADDGATPSGGARAWIVAHFEGAPVVTGTVTRRTAVETPALVRDADGCCAKYAFDVREEEAPDDRQVGFVDVTIHDLVSTDGFGGGIQSASAAGLTLYLAHVVVDPGWPLWVSYDETNYDGLVLDGAAAIYAEDLTIRDWNADGAIDNKATISQFVRLTIEGRGHRALRYWGPGPHYLVDSRIENDGGAGEGSLLWFRDCGAVELRIYGSTFGGSPTVPASAIRCDEGADPEIVYLTDDPRTTGELHEMFAP